ncbi:hormone receptor 4 [Onthophagus taurus]|uniref:hormone receptor 4 n=1 Tax=Onthophagus taurus TaxID=166361 RepID=UPI0039BEA819
MTDGWVEMSSLGIMTLTRTPCELDKMSLFQDLKLKRRKVDSRCSSDGESVADTSTSSPDLISPASPKMSEVVQNPPSPDSTPGRGIKLEPLGHEPLTTGLEDSGVFDGGGISIHHHPETNSSSNRNTSVIKPLPIVSRSHSPPPVLRPPSSASPVSQPPRPHSSPGRPANVSPVIRHSPSLIMHPPTSPQRQQQGSPGCHSGGVSSPPFVSNMRSLGVITTQNTVIQNQLWFQSPRINGVKPELIGGNFGANLLSPHRTSNVNIKGAPTVIMGESGGVRTMVWKNAEDQEKELLATGLPTTSGGPMNWSPGLSSNSTGSNPEENAAQMLLNLGQERRPSIRSPAPNVRSSPHHNPSSISSPISHFTNVPLNMERLWAGDLTQIPGSAGNSSNLNLPLTNLSSSSSSNQQALNLSSPTSSSLASSLSSSLSPTQQHPNSMIYGSGGGRTGGLLQDVVQLQQQQQQQDCQEEEEQPMICMICEDKATGLHYGIITCEGCKGFFKRTVQNRRVYTCVADGNCEITKAQRNRCQYCRFKKCIEQGMVLQAVREDRMPGGRNSGAVYNLYKVKYKKHKKTAAKQTATKPADKPLQLSPQMKQESPTSIPSHLVNGTILKTALTNPSEVVHLRQRLDSAVSSSRDRNYSIEYTRSMIQTLIDCDDFQDIATLENLEELLDHKSDLNSKLIQIGDSIVYKLVQWTKRLPFYLELPVEVHTRLLTHKWHELLVLTTSAYQAIHFRSHKRSLEQMASTGETDFNQEVNNNLQTLQTCLASMMGKSITMEQLRQDVGLMVEKITHVTLMFRRINLTMEEYVCLKVITMLNQARAGVTGSPELENIQERYMTCLRAYTQHIYPQDPTRFQDLLVRLPEVQSAAALLLESKMFYVPFLLNSAIQR